MSTDIDWQHELDTSFGSGHDVPAGHYVAAGRTAVRRRRLTAAVVGLGAAAVVGGIAWGVAPHGGPSSSDAPIATEPSRTASQTPAPSREVEKAPELPWKKGDPPARSSPDGLALAPGSVVHERVDNLFPGRASESVALDISRGGERWWMTLEWDSGGAAMSSTRPTDGLFDSFDDFVRAEILGGGMTTQPATVDDTWFAGLVQWTGGELRTRKGVVVVKQVDQPVSSDLPSVGLVLVKDGVTTWMLIADGGASAGWTEEADSGWATFEEWLVDQVALQSGQPELQLVSLDGDGAVIPREPGVVVLEQQADPDLGAYGTDAEGATSAVALLEWKEQRWFVLAVRTGGQTSVTPVAAGKAGGARTLDEFVAFMADRADEGGMR